MRAQNSCCDAATQWMERRPGATVAWGRGASSDCQTLALDAVRRRRFGQQRPNVLPGLLLFLTTVAACTSGTTATCRVDGDCASRHCGPDGECQDYALADPDAADASPRFGDASGDVAGQGDSATTSTDAATAGADSVASVDSEVAGDDTSGSGDTGAGDAGVPPWTCVPNHDGRVDRIEIHFAPNLSAPFRVASDASFQPQGQAGSDGKPVWDLASALASDKDVQVGTEPVAGRWFSADFAGATYAARLAVDSPLLGVFEATGDALLLRGVVSPDDGLLATKLVYDPPAKVLAFPLQEGTSFASSSIVTGKKDGVYALWNESWTSVADHRGIVQTPYGNFPSLRVRTTLTRKVGILEYVTRSFAWVAECYGTVASARSKLDEPALEFTTAEELRRLAVPK